MVRGPLVFLLGVSGSLGAGLRIDPAKVAIYIRWSTDDQSEGTTLDVQRDACLNQARAWGWGDVPAERIFVDDGYSGASLKRPAMTQLRRLVKRGEIQCVIVYKIDRLSRNIVDATQLVLDEWDQVCHLKVVMEPVDTTTDLGRMIFGILAMFADFERSSIKSRTFSGKVQRAKEGRFTGHRLPFGYKHGGAPGEIVKDEHQASVVRRIFERWAAGLGAVRIAEELNADGIKSYFGRTWNKVSIQKMIKNDAYLGQFGYGETKANPRYGKVPGEPRRIPRDEPLAVAYHPELAIVSQELYDQCQRIRQSRREAMTQTSGRSLRGQYLLTGIARCRCGYPFQAHWSDAKTKKNTVYLCQGRTGKGPSFCDCSQIPMRDADQVVVNRIMSLRDPAVKANLFQRHSAELDARIADLRTQLAKLEEGDRRLADEATRVRRDYRAGKLSAEAMAQLQEDLAEDKAVLAAAGERVGTELRANQTARERWHLIESSIAQLDAWEVLEPEQRKQLLRDLVSRIVLYRPGRTAPVQIELEFRVRDELEL